MPHPPADPYQSTLNALAPNASRLKRSANARLGRALLGAVNLHLLAVAGYWFAAYATAESAVPETKGTVYVEVPIFATPPIDEAPTLPPGGAAPVRSDGDLGVPTPVPDAEADPDATVATEVESLADPGVGPVGPVARAGDGSGEGNVPTTPRGPVVPKPGDPPSAPPTVETPEVEEEPVAEEPVVRTFSEVMPELIGGIGALQAGIEYPAFDRQVGMSGKVMVQFVVNEDGAPSDVVVVRSVSPGLDRAAVEAVRRARFTPGLQNGRPVKVQYTLPVTFQLR